MTTWVCGRSARDSSHDHRDIENQGIFHATRLYGPRLAGNPKRGETFSRRHQQQACTRQKIEFSSSSWRKAPAHSLARLDGWMVGIFSLLLLLPSLSFPSPMGQERKNGKSVWRESVRVRERENRWVGKVERETRFPFFSLTLSCIAKPERERVYFCLFSLSSAGRKSWRHQIYAKVIQLRLPIGLLGTVNHVPTEDWEP